MVSRNIDIPMDRIEEFCRRWKIRELSLFGSVLREDFRSDGDYVVVESGSKVEEGQIGVVLLDDEATVKRVFVQKGRIALRPANEKAGYKTRYVKPHDKNVRIVGKVIGCIRTGIR